MGIFPRLNIAKRSHPSNPANWLLYGLSGERRSYTGKTVTEDTALDATAVWSGVTQLAQTKATLPLHLFKKLPNEKGKEKATSNPLYRILYLQPNPEMTAVSFHESQMGQCITHGTCYAEIERNNADTIKGLWPLLSKNMDVDRLDGELIYKYELPNGDTKIFSKRNILRVSGFSKNGIVGISPIIKGKQAIGLSLALEEYGARFFGNNARPSVVLEHPEKLGNKAQDNLKKSWNEMHEGLSNSHRLAILEEGMQLKEFGVSPEQAQAIESRKFQLAEVARLLNMPPHMLKDLDKSSFNNIETQSLEFVIYSLRPWLVRFEQAYNTQLINPSKQNTLFFEHIVDGLLRGDTKTRHETYATGIQWGYYSANDVRSLENKNAINGGDEYLRPLNMVTVSQSEELHKQSVSDSEDNNDAKNEDESTEEKSIRENRSLAQRDRLILRYYPLFKAAAQKVVNKEFNAVTKRVNKRAKRDNFGKWVDSFYDDTMTGFVRQEFAPVIRSFGDAIVEVSEKETGENIPQEESEKFIEDYTDRYVQRYVDSSKGQLIKLDEDGEDVEERVEEWKENRPDKEAFNETQRESNAAYQLVAFAGGFSTYWRIRGATTCPYCKEFNGKKIRSGGSFVSDGDEVKPKGLDPMKINGTKAHPPLHRGCDCYASII